MCSAIKVPAGVKAEETFQVQIGDTTVKIRCPAGAAEGSTLAISSQVFMRHVCKSSITLAYNVKHLLGFALMCFLSFFL